MPSGRQLTERMRFTVPAATKARLEEEAKSRGLSLSAYVRDKLDDEKARSDFEAATERREHVEKAGAE